jgi:autotransporter-associated beta strand protein
VIEGSGPDGLGAVRNTTCSIASYSFISNMTLTADAVLGAQARWDIGPMAGSTVDGGGYKLIKTGADGLGFRPQFITNLAALVITNGRLWHENYDRTNTWDTTITNYATSGGRLGIYGGRTFAMPVVLDAGQIYNEGGGTPTWNSYIRIDSGSVFNNGGAQNFYGQIDGSGAMWVDGGTSALTLTNANTYAGGTVISNAPVTTAAANAASGGAAVIARDPSALGTGPVTIDGTAYSALSANPYFFRTNVLRAVEFAIDGPATVANNIILPSVTVSNASLHGRDATRVINLTGAISGGFSGFTNWIDFGAAGNGVIRYANPANNFIGTVSVFRGILGITADGALGNSANVVRLNSGALRFDAPNVNLAHGLFATASGSTLYLIGDNNGDGTLDTANNVTISGVISGGTAVNVRGTNGVLTLTGNNTMTSGYELLEPVTLEVASGANLGTAAAYVALKGGSTFRYTGTGTETWTRSIWNDTGTLGGGTIDIPNASASLTWNGGGTINQALSKTGAGSLTITAPGISGGILTVNGGAMTVNSVISGAGTLVQVNTGTLTLGGANTYGGPTLVSGGSLFVNGSIPAANAVTVASGGTLAGNGTINCPVDLQAGSALRPGAGPNTIGTLTVKSPLAMAGTTTTTMEIDGTGGTGDAVVAMSTVTYGGALTVNNTTGTPAPGTKFTLFSAVDRLGAFTTVTLPPATPPSYWTNLLAIDGSIQYVSPVSQTPVPVTWGISGGNLNLSWPTDHIGWRLLVQTNALNVGLVTNSTAWTAWPNSENVNSVSIPLDSANGTVFYKMVYP